ncbi:PAS domain-containing sensor histidine kinase [Natrialbaceae archaeon A-gly3]
MSSLLDRRDLDRDDAPEEGGFDIHDVRVLFVDDDGAFGDLVATYLEDEHDFTVRVETAAEDALEALEDDSRISCVVSDYEMPGADGLDLLEAVKAHSPALPFVMFAGQGSERVASEAIQLGADDYLEKDTGDARYDLLANRIESCVTIARQQRKLTDLYAAIEDAGHAMLVTGRDGTITYANPTMEAVTGYRFEEMLGQSPALFKSDEHGEEFYGELWSTILDGEIWHGEVTNERKDGSQYVIDQTISPITDAAGAITGFVAINRDITDRKERERELAFFEQAIEQVGTGIAAYDEEGIVQYANEAYAEMLGTTPDSLEGSHTTNVNPGFDTDRFQAYWDSFEDGETRRREAVHRRFDRNEEFPVDVTSTHVAHDDREYHVGTIQDITERKRRERKLRLFRQAVEHAGHAVVITDTDGTIEYVNPAFEEETGYDAEAAIGETPAILKSGEHSQEFYGELWSTILAGRVWHGEIVNRRSDGSTYHVDQTIAPITDEEEISGFVAVNRDISELKAYERELEAQNDRLERFGRTVAHDLRNPLHVMDGYLDIARDADDPETAHREIQEAVDRMGELIDELLALAEHGQTVVDPEPISLEDVALRAWGHVDTESLTLEVDGSATILGDDSYVVQLFENLGRNAREHAGPEATVRVGVLEDGFYVEDDGPGIPEGKREAVLESGYTTSKSGTGFGLAIVNQIARSHGWDVSITEGTEGGARFEFRGLEFV